MFRKQFSGSRSVVTALLRPRGAQTILLAAALLTCGLGTAAAQFTNSNHVSFTLEGCRNDGIPLITLPNGSGQFICPDGGTPTGGAYTTGNLGKGWNELDLVPHRLITQSGGQSDVTTTYNVIVAADYQSTDNQNVVRTGYDVISVPGVNTTYSAASCQVTAASQLTSNAVTGGTDLALYRVLTISQNANTTCVFDYYLRLALGAHLYPGSSLQSYMFERVDFQTGKKTISIPVNEILPQSLSKDMSAVQDSTYPWDLRKSATTNMLSFGDVCAVGAPTNLPLSITVTWTRDAPTPAGLIRVHTNVYATNPAARTITANVTDVIYSGTTAIDTTGPTSKDVPANTANYLVLEHTITVPSGTTNLNDVATATYTDLVTGFPVPGQTTAMASAPVQSSDIFLNTSASILDVESMTGTGLTFSVPAPSFGSFVADGMTAAYTAADHTQGPVDWLSGTQSASSSITFDKTVYLSGTRITSGVLTDSANLTGSDGLTMSAGPVTANVTSSASPRITINKTIPPGLFTTGTVVVSFKVTRASAPGYSALFNLTFASSDTSKSNVVTGPDADTYYVEETGATYFNATTCSAGCPASLSPSGGSTRTVNLTADENGLVTCTGTANFANAIPTTSLPSVQVQKTTNPATDSSNWTFTLNGPGLPPTGLTATAVGNGGYVPIGAGLTLPGTYTVTETTKSAWYLYSANPNNGTNTKVCSFTVNYPADFVAGKLFSCDFINSQQYARIIKTVQTLAPSGTQSFTFQLRQNATAMADGNTLESQSATATNGGTFTFAALLIPGQTYQVCEIVMPGWLTSLGNFVPGSFMPPNGVATNPAVDNSILCGNFTVAAGETKTFTVDNTPPPGGRALTIGYWKNWASCSGGNGKQKPVLDQTLYLFGSTGEVISATSGTFAVFGATYYLQLHGGTTANVATDCSKAVNLLNKSTISGAKMASDPAFNLAAQLVAAELNFEAGAGRTPTATTAINQSVLLLGKYKFNGAGYTGKISAADATTMNNLATTLDNYNNDRP
jgi:hypothetical protein